MMHPVWSWRSNLNEEGLRYPSLERSSGEQKSSLMKEPATPRIGVHDSPMRKSAMYALVMAAERMGGARTCQARPLAN